MITRRTFGIAGAATLAGVAAGTPLRASAQAAPDVAGLQGADRTQRLIDGAKREGTISIYASMPVEDMQVITAAFEQKYGVKATIWRASSENLLQRVVTEARARRFEVDIVETNGPELEALHRERILVPVRSPLLTELLPAAVQSHGEWVGTRLNVYALAYNTNLVKKEELPNSWAGFVDAKWRGRLGIEAENWDWFAAVVSKLGEEQGLRIFREIVAGPGISIRRGHTLLSNLVASGEVPLALTIYDYRGEQLRASGAPVDFYYIQPTPARVNGVAMHRAAPRPHAAALFYDFMLSDAQDILAQRGFSPTNIKRKPLPAGLDINIINSAQMLAEGQKWQALWRDTVTRGARG
ncbi:MAG: ABC transporter substrate-binding protein [Rhodospirillales bacterium]